MEDTDNRQHVVSAGVEFLRSLAECYGSETAMTMWEGLGVHIDPEVRGEVFMAMLCGTGSSRLRLRPAGGYAVSVDRISLIKTIRTWDRRRLSLKEAKDMSDVFGAPNPDLLIEINMPDRGNAVRDFAKIGVTAY
jgi:hypothetical protein